MITGTAVVKGPHEVVAETTAGIEELHADAVLLSTGSRPRIPDWASPTASACSPPDRPTRRPSCPSTSS